MTLKLALVKSQREVVDDYILMRIQKIQLGVAYFILTVLEQRSKYGGKPEQARIAKKAKESLKRQHGTKKISAKS